MSNPLNHAAGAALLLTLMGGLPGETRRVEAQTPTTRPDDGALVRLTVGGTPDRAVVELIATRPPLEPAAHRRRPAEPTVRRPSVHRSRGP